MLQLEWTNQHGCGGNEENDPHKLNCNLVIQFMVQNFIDGEQDGECVVVAMLLFLLLLLLVIANVLASGIDMVAILINIGTNESN